MTFFNLPIALTWGRILAIPLLVAAFYLPKDFCSLQTSNLLATIIFVLAALTDWADGFLARKLNQTSAFGAFLDPVADKLMVATALIILVSLNRCDAVLAAIIIGREITISALREWMAKIGAAQSVAVSMLGKIKTSAQMLAIPLLLYQKPILLSISGFEIDLNCGKYLLFIAAILTIWSMFYYLQMALKEIKQKLKNN
ncbi:MAG: CDP-diacylglycerol--glycerol-3-phosphate 3-phosphatidyltransferase [Rhodocyclaceae bacterium]